VSFAIIESDAVAVSATFGTFLEPGWNLDAFRNVVSIIARVEAGDEMAAAAQASAALERRTSLVGLGGGEVAPAERRIAYALAGVSILVLIIGLANAGRLAAVGVLCGCALAVLAGAGCSRCLSAPPRPIRSCSGPRAL